MSLKTKALTRGPALITLIMVTLFLIGYSITSVLGIPRELGLPPPLRLLGTALALAGLGMMVWTFRVRGFVGVAVSTYITYWKIVNGAPLEAKSGREEPLVVAGPYKYARNPLYFGVVLIVLGLALDTSSSFVLITTAIVFAWFRVLLIPYEEREMRALFGAQFERYSAQVPAMIPFTKWRKSSKVGETGEPPLAARPS